MFRRPLYYSKHKTSSFYRDWSERNILKRNSKIEIFQNENLCTFSFDQISAVRDYSNLDQMELNLEPLRLFIDLNIVVSPKKQLSKEVQFGPKVVISGQNRRSGPKEPLSSPFKIIQISETIRLSLLDRKHRFVYEYT